MAGWQQLLALVFLFAPVAEPVTIQSAVDTLRRGASLEVAGERICAAHPLPLFYDRRQFRPAWSAADADALLDAVRHASDDGLDPLDYHLAAIDLPPRQPLTLEERDLLLTDAFFLLASHILSGRIDPVTIEPTWCLEPRTSDLVPALETSLENHDVA